MSVVSIPKILLPQKDISLEKWATIACDQFTAEPMYWQELDSFVGEAPSTLRLTYPEIYLGKKTDASIKAVQAKMEEYIENGVFQEVDGLILVERQVAGAKRFGLMCAIDLEDYDFNRVRKPIRATEDTILARLPVRVEIRRGASLEFPHAIILVDDAERAIIEPLAARKESLKKLYDFNLNMGGGNIKGYLVDNPRDVLAKIEALGNPQKQIEKYGSDEGIVLAIGDGNHSIATAKVFWDELKQKLTPTEQENHPARFALVEVVNIYGGGMDFEPIHRAIWNGGEEFVNGLRAALSFGSGGAIKLISGNNEEVIPTSSDAAMVIKAIQSYIESTLKIGKIKVDYIHGEDHLNEVVRADESALGIVMPKFPASELFGYVTTVGNLPKKAFSIGEPNEKRYYLEGRRITK